MRFYQRAVSTYDEGLKKYSKSFDLAYNKALLLYNITQDKRIVVQVGSLLDVLKEALDAHRYALALDQENADVLFNTAQVLTSFAEEMHDEADGDDDVKAQAISLLQEAVELFNSCLTRQEMEYTEMQEIWEAQNQNADEGVPLSSAAAAQSAANSTADDTPGEWATVKEAVTPNTLLETALAQLGSLSSLATIAAPTTSSLLANLSEIASPIVTQKLPGYIALLPTSVSIDPDTAKSTPFLSISASSSTFHGTQAAQQVNPQAAAHAEADLAVAVFTAAIAGAEYSSRLSETHQYRDRIQQAFASLSQNAASGVYPEASHVAILSAYADALIEFAETIAEMEDSLSQAGREEALMARWTALGMAQAQLTTATNKIGSTPLPEGAPTKAQIYLTRGNVELLRRQLALDPRATSTLKSSVKVLLKNAGVYYRGASALSKQDGDAEGERDASVRNKVVQGLEQEAVKEDADALKEWVTREGGGKDAVEVLQEMIEEGLLAGEG